MFYPVYERALDIRLVDMSCFLFVCLFVCFLVVVITHLRRILDGYQHIKLGYIFRFFYWFKNVLSHEDTARAHRQHAIRIQKDWGLVLKRTVSMMRFFWIDHIYINYWSRLTDDRQKKKKVTSTPSPTIPENVRGVLDTCIYITVHL